MRRNVSHLVSGRLKSVIRRPHELLLGFDHVAANATRSVSDVRPARHRSH
jgi:hypothetical protein